MFLSPYLCTSYLCCTGYKDNAGPWSQGKNSTFQSRVVSILICRTHVRRRLLPCVTQKMRGHFVICCSRNSQICKMTKIALCIPAITSFVMAIITNSIHASSPSIPTNVRLCKSVVAVVGFNLSTANAKLSTSCLPQKTCKFRMELYVTMNQVARKHNIMTPPRSTISV